MVAGKPCTERLTDFRSGREWAGTMRSAGLFSCWTVLQARYEFTRKFAPYVELSRTLFPRALPGGFGPETSLLAGLRLIF